MSLRSSSHIIQSTYHSFALNLCFLSTNERYNFWHFRVQTYRALCCFQTVFLTISNDPSIVVLNLFAEDVYCCIVCWVECEIDGRHFLLCPRVASSILSICLPLDLCLFFCRFGFGTFLLLRGSDKHVNFGATLMHCEASSLKFSDSERKIVESYVAFLPTPAVQHWTCFVHLADFDSDTAEAPEDALLLDFEAKAVQKDTVLVFVFVFVCFELSLLHCWTVRRTLYFSLHIDFPQFFVFLQRKVPVMFGYTKTSTDPGHCLILHCYFCCWVLGCADLRIFYIWAVLVSRRWC